jgi:hypothetical protein
MSAFLLLMNLSVHSVSAQDLIYSPWHITATDTTNYSGITLANGRIGLLTSKEPLKVESIILNNVFDKESPIGVSKILQGMNFGNLEVEIDMKNSKANISN